MLRPLWGFAFGHAPDHGRAATDALPGYGEIDEVRRQHAVLAGSQLRDANCGIGRFDQRVPANVQALVEALAKPGRHAERVDS